MVQDVLHPRRFGPPGMLRGLGASAPLFALPGRVGRSNTRGHSLLGKGANLELGKDFFLCFWPERVDGDLL